MNGSHAIQPVAALDAEAVPSQIVVSARRADQAARRVCLQPPLVLPPVPDPVLRAQHPPPAFAVEHGQVAHGDPEGTRLQASDAPLLDERVVADLGFRERVDCHAGEYAATRLLESNRL